MKQRNSKKPKDRKPLAFFSAEDTTPKEPESRHNSDEILNLTIEKLSFGGNGVARANGLVYFVPFTTPGDIIHARVVTKKKNFARAEIVEIISAGPSRIKAPCSVYEKCGGCNWQHLNYAEQLLQKQNIIKEQLGFILNENPDILLPIIKSEKDFFYRNRIQVRFDGKNVGYYGRKTHQLVPIKECLIAEEKINSRLGRLTSELIALKTPSESKFELLVDKKNELHMRNTQSDDDSDGFSQVNTSQNQKLIELVLAEIESFAYEHVYDLYAGSGNFTFPVADKLQKAKFQAVELNSASVRRGKELAERSKFYSSRIKFFLSDVESYLRRTFIENDSLVILDPPRSGCSSEVLAALKAAKPLKIIYISCNPSSLARDLKILLDQSALKIRKIQAFDMFPQTDHIETLVVMEH